MVKKIEGKCIKMASNTFWKGGNHYLAGEL